jgi:hypothetical protein
MSAEKRNKKKKYKVSSFLSNVKTRMGKKMSFKKSKIII